MKKYFVLDTNVLLHSAESLFCFEEHHVILPLQVIEELDRFKKEPDERGRNARTVARALDRLRNQGPLYDGVETESGGTVQVLTDFEYTLHSSLDRNVIDNQIIGAAHYVREHMARKKRGKKAADVIFVSKDLNARIKADALGILAEDFESNKVNFDELYRGWDVLSVNEQDLDLFEDQGFLEVEPERYLSNEFLILSNGEEEVLGRFDSHKGGIVPLSDGYRAPWGVSALNPQQHFALECLLNNQFQLVTLVGQAGTGKTLLALAAGLQRTIDDLSYKRILVSRPIMPLGRDIGYLPGSKEEKLAHWMQPIFDNLHFIFDNYITDGLPSEHLDLLMRNEKISLEALTYIRGRSIANQWLMIDEAQNLTPHEIKTIISRAGNGTKVIVTGDPYQIDNPYLDPSSNGLTYLVERFKGQSIFGSVTLNRSERSELASLAVDLL